MGEESKPPVTIYVSYAQHDEALKQEFEDYLAMLQQTHLIAGWVERQVQPGTDWSQVIDPRLEAAQIFLLLVSPSLLASGYLFGAEFRRAFEERRQKGEMVVVPILLHRVDLTGYPLALISALPRMLGPVSSWPKRNDAWVSVYQEIRWMIERRFRGSFVTTGERVEYIPVERAIDAFQQPVELPHLIAMCRRAFGEQIQIESIQELQGGLYNNTYLIAINERLSVILRVGPHATRQFASERNLMRNEHTSQPFLAPIAPLLPRILMADFTHQILERDYLFQTYKEGEQWAQVMQTFTAEEKKVLWRQLGSIAKQIHGVKGQHFGNSVLDAHFSSWSETVVDCLETIIRDLVDIQLDATDVRSLLSIAQANQGFLDEITQPCLLHGDLWTVNILVKRSEAGPRIVAILDSDRTSWGDPMADWTMFLLQRAAGTEVDAFWETYGQPEKGPGAQFRSLLYQGRYLGAIRLEQHRLHHHEAVRRSYQDMQAVMEALSNLHL
ncbi:MAG TPA: phosphotransferase [Ktedonobacteraceae bacterium]|nr:phosphotransferase [Ktedonobacteraceae bacterium]